MTDSTSSNAADSAKAIESIRGFYGDSLHASEWFLVTQEMVDKFGIATSDSHWIHTDPDRASRESPYGTTIAQGFWTLSMLTHLFQSATNGIYPPGALFGINYGLDGVRFPGPVPVGKRIRLQFKLLDIARRNDGQYLIKTENVIEVEGQDKPALVANWLFLLIYGA